MSETLRSKFRGCLLGAPGNTCLSVLMERMIANPVGLLPLLNPLRMISE